jgi:hypothetical protein
MAGPIKDFWPGRLPDPSKQPSRPDTPMLRSEKTLPRISGTKLGFEVEKG